jgi:hypothetical protein
VAEGDGIGGTRSEALVAEKYSERERFKSITHT